MYALLRTMTVLNTPAACRDGRNYKEAKTRRTYRLVKQYAKGHEPHYTHWYPRVVSPRI